MWFGLRNLNSGAKLEHRLGFDIVVGLDKSSSCNCRPFLRQVRFWNCIPSLPQVLEHSDHELQEVHFAWHLSRKKQSCKEIITACLHYKYWNMLTSMFVSGRSVYFFQVSIMAKVTISFKSTDRVLPMGPESPGIPGLPGFPGGLSLSIPLTQAY